MDEQHGNFGDAPAGWLEVLERSEAQLAAGKVVSGVAVRRRLKESIAALEAETAPGTVLPLKR